MSAPEYVKISRHDLTRWKDAANMIEVLLERGTLCRNTDNDHKKTWHQDMLELVMHLKNFSDVIKEMRFRLDQEEWNG